MVSRRWQGFDLNSTPECGEKGTNDPHERGATRNTARPWWIALKTMKELENCQKKLDRGIFRKRRNWATQQRAEVNKLELVNQLRRTWENLLLEYFEDEMGAFNSAKPLMANPFIRTAGQLMFTWSLAGVALEMVISCDRPKLGDKGLRVYQMLRQHIARENSGLTLARRKDATCFVSRIMSVMLDITVQACSKKVTGNKAIERRVSAVILNVYQSSGIAKGEGSRQSLENYGKLDEIRRFSNKKFREDHDVHRNMALAEDLSEPTKRR